MPLSGELSTGFLPKTNTDTWKTGKQNLETTLKTGRCTYTCNVVHKGVQARAQRYAPLRACLNFVQAYFEDCFRGYFLVIMRSVAGYVTNKN